MKYVFIVTHYGSGGITLCQILNNSPRVCALGASTMIYDHPSTLDYLRILWNQKDHRTRTESYWYIDKLLLNHQFASKSLYNICKFIYLIREPVGSMSGILEKGYNPEKAADYYVFRLQRICEMAVQTPQAVIMTYDDLIQHKFTKINTYLNLKTPLVANKLIEEEKDHSSLVTFSLERCLKAYNKYANFLEAVD